MVFDYLFEDSKSYKDILCNVRYCFFVDSDMIDDTNYIFNILFSKKKN